MISPNAQVGPAHLTKIDGILIGHWINSDANEFGLKVNF